jgi:hypothetical protein
MRTAIITLLLLTQLSFVQAGAAYKNTGTFSSLYYHKESGDLLGYEIRIVYTRHEYQGTFQAAEGEPDDLILIRSIMINDNKVRFLIPGPSLYEGEFVGQITDKGLTGTLTLRNGVKNDIGLKRQRSYWD